MEEKLVLVVRWIGNHRNGVVCCALKTRAEEIVNQLNEANVHESLKYFVEDLLDEETAIKEELDSLEQYKNR